ncbi:MAG: glycosyltransferase family 39 protein [Candidatus Parcubacteria bacterium]|nr:glycosyltransferase family 39 protein [Candidatus Parcubacteria bacterium]
MSKLSKFIALGILGLMFILMFFSSWDDAATFDEVAHIPAGYSYLTQKDYRLNPEHPPLIKDLSAIPLLFLKLNFPVNIKAWTEDVNGQWEMGRVFLYESGNNPDKILHWARFPIMLLALVFGWLLFMWISRLYGNKVGLLTLFFFSLSPTIIAHSRYVTTDLGAAFGFFIGIVSFTNFLANQTKKNLIVAGIVFGIAQLLKFSLIVLAPLYFLLGILWIIISGYSFRELLKITGKIILIGLIGLVVIWAVYQFHVWNYPLERQIQDIKTTLTSPGAKPFVNLIAWLSDKHIFQGLGEYLFGLLMVIQREVGGNSAYFLGNVSATGSYLYFPLLYLVKEPLGFLILAFIALIIAFYNIKNINKNWLKDNFAIVASIIFIVVYFTQAVTGNLNIGIRHILPILPFIYFLTAVQVARLKKYYIIIPLLMWLFLSTLITFPYYLSYYNILAGGVQNGYKIATDSNYDWGQDLKRLKNFVDENKINKINLDYFGGGSPQYYFDGKFIPWWGTKSQPSTGSWLAVSVNTFQGNKDYSWLKGKIPVARAGSSIFIYKF